MPHPKKQSQSRGSAARWVPAGGAPAAALKEAANSLSLRLRGRAVLCCCYGRPGRQQTHTDSDENEGETAEEAHTYLGGCLSCGRVRPKGPQQSAVKGGPLQR